MSRRENAREALMVAAERLIAEQGANVALRDIAAAAGQGNNSAVHYYFGSREGLINAMLDRRMAELANRHLTLLAELEGSPAANDVATMVDVLVRPMFEVPYGAESTHYARFLEQVRTHASVVDQDTIAQRWPAIRIVTKRLFDSLSDMPAKVRRQRLLALTTVMASLIADVERRCERLGVPMARDEATIGEVVAMITGMLTAPPRLGR